MNDELKIFHGSNVVVESPKILVMGFYKDFGYGFYCTSLEKQAQKWAISKKEDSIVSVYQYQPNLALKIKTFPTMTEEWLDFVVNCRRGIPHNYDIVVGPIADDGVAFQLERFHEQMIDAEVLARELTYRELTRQYFFGTERAITKLRKI